MGRGPVLILLVCEVTGCGGDAQDSGRSAGGAVGVLPPSAQGAFLANVSSMPPPPSGKTCPSGQSITFDMPEVISTANPAEALDADTYRHWVTDGEDGTEVTCAVKGAGAFSVEGTIRRGATAFAISGGTLGADHTGTARIALVKSTAPGFSGTLAAPSNNCTIDASAAPGGNLQLKPGSVWAHFSCPSVEQAPADYCRAEGYFVLENCEQ